MVRNRKMLVRESIVSYKQKIELIQAKVTPLLSRTTNVNIDYTEHTIEHSLNIEELYGACFNEIIGLLSDDEKFLLISATLIHDIGMVGQSKYQFEEDYAAEVRDSHQYRSADFVNEFREELMLEQREAQAIIKIVEGHRVRDMESIAEKEPYGYGDVIRLRFLAALLRMGDELDILEERAPELVKKYLDVRPESLIHHERHEICTGIARDPETNIIQIKATIRNNRLEVAVIDLFNGIKKKYDELKVIFQKNQVSINNIEIIMDTEQVVSQEICLYLAYHNVNEQELINQLKTTRKYYEINESIRKLKSKKIMIIDSKGRYSLNPKEKYFKVLLNTFLRTEFELQFTKSVFVENYLNENFAEYVNAQFGGTYSEGDKQDRILLLTHFPTSLEYFFDPRNTPYEFGNFDRKVTLDLGLLHALSVDVLKYPQELKNEVYLAAQAIARTTSDDIFPLLKICSSIPDAAKKKGELNELFERGINPYDREDNQQIAGKFTVSTTLTQNQLPNLDFMTLMLASGIAGVPIEFSKDISMKDIVFNDYEGFDEIQNSKFVSLKVMPNIEHKQFSESALFNFEINYDKRELTIKLLKDIIGKPEHYPYEIKFSSDGTEDITFNFNCNMCGKVPQIEKFNKLMEYWENEGFRRLLIYSGEDGREPIKIVPPKVKNRGTGTFINKFKNILTILKINTDDCPYLIKSDLIREIENLEEKDFSEDICKKLIDEINKVIPKKITKVYLHIIDREEKTLITKCLDILPYLFDFKSLNIKTYNNNKKSLIKNIYERNDDLTLRKYCYGYTLHDFFDLMVSIFESTNKYKIEKVLDYLSKDKGDLAQILILINFRAVKSTLWQEEQTIEIILKTDELEIEKINTINRLICEEKYVDIIPLMDEPFREQYLENLAFAYCVKGDYTDSINIANSAIQRNYKSIAHFTKGLALVLSGEVEQGFKSYMNGTFLIDKKIWYPIVLENLLKYLNNKDIEMNDGIEKIIDRLKFYSLLSGKKLNKRCFCGSKRHYSICCGKEFMN